MTPDTPILLGTNLSDYFTVHLEFINYELSDNENEALSITSYFTQPQNQRDAELS